MKCNNWGETLEQP